MKTLWCWRCRTDVPMLDETEFRRIEEVNRRCTDQVKEGCRAPNVDVIALVNAGFEPMRRLYKEMTGFAESNQLVILHHRIALYGPPCSACGKVLRTPKSRRCIECGEERRASG